MDSSEFSSLETSPGEKHLGAKQISKNFHFPWIALDKKAGGEPHTLMSRKQINISELALGDVDLVF